MWDPRKLSSAAFTGEKSPRCLRVLGARRLGGPGSAPSEAAAPLLRATLPVPWGSACIFSDGSVTLVNASTAALGSLGGGGAVRSVCGSLALGPGRGEALDAAQAVAGWGARAAARFTLQVGVDVLAGCQGAVLDFASGTIAFPHVRTLRAVDDAGAGAGAGAGGAAPQPRMFLGRTGDLVGAHVPMDFCYSAVAVVNVWTGSRRLLEGAVGAVCLEAGWQGEAFVGVEGGRVATLIEQ